MSPEPAADTATQPAADTATDLSGYSLSKRITLALTAIFTDYAGKAPTEARTVIRGNVVTTSMTDAVGAFEANLKRDQPEHGIEGINSLTKAGYERAVIAAVADLTEHRVTALTSTHDRENDVAVERFSLESGRRARRRRSARASAS